MNRQLDSVYGQTLCGAISLGGAVDPVVVQSMLDAVVPDNNHGTHGTHGKGWAVATTCEAVKLSGGVRAWFDGDWELNGWLGAKGKEQGAKSGQSTVPSPQSTVHTPHSTLGGSTLLSLPGGWCGAFVTSDDRIHLACDRIGIRDLYYTEHDGVLYFSTIIRAFWKIHGWTTDTDNRRVCEYMAYRRIAGKHTMYVNVDRVLPGECLGVGEGRREESGERRAESGEHREGSRGGGVGSEQSTVNSPPSTVHSLQSTLHGLPSTVHPPLSTISCMRYWAYRWEPNSGLSLDDALDALHDLLKEQLKSIDADENLVPSLMLSGGVDSAGLLAEGVDVGLEMNSLTLAPDDAGFSEENAVDDICNHLGCSYDVVPVDADLLVANMEAGHFCLEQPVVHTIALLHMGLYEKMRENGCNAFVCGEAADTLFGYDRFAKYRQIWQHSSPIVDWMMGLAGKLTKQSRFKLWAALTSDDWRGFVCKGRRYFGDEELEKLRAEIKVRGAESGEWRVDGGRLGVDGREREDVPHPTVHSPQSSGGIDDVRMGILGEGGGESGRLTVDSPSSTGYSLQSTVYRPQSTLAESRLEASSRYYFETFIQDCRIFIALGRAAGVEPILPYAASAVRDFALALPVDQKFRKGKGKFLLKQAMSDRLPPDVVWAKKCSGEQPLGRWMRENEKLRGMVEWACGNESTVGRFMDVGGLKNKFDEHVSGEADHSVLLWQVLSLDVWMRGNLEI